MDFKFRAYHPTSGLAYFTFDDIRRIEVDPDEYRGGVRFPDGEWQPLSECEVMMWTEEQNTR